jgi:hypothetical protein
MKTNTVILWVVFSILLILTSLSSIETVKGFEGYPSHSANMGLLIGAGIASLVVAYLIRRAGR